MRKGKTIKLFTTVTLSLTMLGMTACGNSGNETGQRTDTVDMENWDTSPEGILARDYSEKLDISYAGLYVEEGFDYNHGNEYNEWWTKTFNVEWEPTGLTFENQNERMNTWINAEDLPDWSVWDFNAADAIKYVDQGLVKKFPDDWKERYPNLAKAAENSPANQYYEDLFGGTYFMFRPMMAENFPADVITPHGAVYLRTDWAKQAGYDLTKNQQTHTITLSEWIDYMQKVKDAGLCEYPLYNAPSELLNAISHVSNHVGYTSSDEFYIGEDDQYHWGPGEEKNGIKDAVKALHDAYEKGLIYPEFYTLETNECEDYFAVSGAAATYFNRGLCSIGDLNNSKMKENLGLNFWDVSDVFVLTDDNGVVYGDPQLNYWNANIISPNCSDEKVERLLSIWDYGCTDEGYKRINLGIKGVDWDEDADGNTISYLVEEGKLLVDKYQGVYPIINGMFIISNDFEFIDPAISEQSKEKFSQLFITRAERYYSKDKEPDWNFLSYTSQALNVASYTYETEYANLITATGDFDKNYDNWLAEKENVIDTALDDLNANLMK